jgi:hypothetical protein
VSQDMLWIHSRTWGQMLTKNASKDQHPQILIFIGKWSMWKRGIVALEQMDW